MIEPSSHFLHGIEKDGVTPEQRMLILQHQIGEAGYAIMKSRRFPDDEDGYLAAAKLGVADAMVQLENALPGSRMEPCRDQEDGAPAYLGEVQGIRSEGMEVTIITCRP